ncbi:MAG: hypothetical protein EOM23_09925 [Candidatus Moranbacteria bacterium]|nr:hypothetical protein [Candidatus Moranbacteria bacterium]
MNNLLNFAKGSTDTSKIRIWTLKDGNPYVVKEKPSSEPLSICVAHDLTEKALFPHNPVTIFVQSLQGAETLFEL